MLLCYRYPEKLDLLEAKNPQKPQLNSFAELGAVHALHEMLSIYIEHKIF